MRILKSHPLLKLANGYIIDASQPSNLSYMWNFGSLLAVCLVIQIVTGVTLAMHYNPSVLEAFNSVEHNMINVNNVFESPYIPIYNFSTIPFFMQQLSAFSEEGLKKLLVYGSEFAQSENFYDKEELAPKLDPWFVTGFVDGEGCFSISIIKDPRYKTGYRIEALFSINLHKKDVKILELIKAFFGDTGNIKYETKREVVSYVIRSKKQLISTILPHFDKFPLVTQKRGDYILFKQAFELIYNNTHLTLDGLKEIVAIKASLNLGLPDKLKVAFPILPTTYKPLFLDPEIPSPYWVAGFTSGEGSFYVGVSKMSSMKSGKQVQLFIYITQHIKDKCILSKLISFFQAGRYHYTKGRSWASYECFKFSDIKSKIIPFFMKYPIVGVKNQDFQDWCKIAYLIDTKSHLTEQGLAEIEKIKEGMNKQRGLDN